MLVKNSQAISNLQRLWQHASCARYLLIYSKKFIGYLNNESARTVSFNPRLQIGDDCLQKYTSLYLLSFCVLSSTGLKFAHRFHHVLKLVVKMFLSAFSFLFCWSLIVKMLELILVGSEPCFTSSEGPMTDWQGLKLARQYAKKFLWSVYKMSWAYRILNL